MRNLFAFASLILIGSLSFQSCTKDRCEQVVTYVVEEPVFVSPEDFRVDIQTEAARNLEKPGKLYFYNQYVFINELRKGIHVIDNTDPSNPQQRAFINIPGNVDMAVRGGILYADSYTDLLAIDLSNPELAVLLHREEMVFPPITETTDGQYLVYYHQELVSETVECDNQDNWMRNGIWAENNVMFDAAGSTQPGAPAAGVGGSMARFTLSGDYLYTVDNNNLHSFSLQQPSQPTKVNSTQLGWGIETIFPYKDKLFVGSSTGMFIYGLSNPTNPNELSRFAHINACDPVFVKDDLAYVTLRDGNFCQGFSNQLELIDVSDARNPKLLKTFPMDNPHGLSISSDNELFVCEGTHGVKVFDVSDPLKLDKNRLDHQRKLHAYDVIVMPGQDDVLLLIGDDGFYQYDFSNPKNLKLLSKIAVQ